MCSNSYFGRHTAGYRRAARSPTPLPRHQFHATSGAIQVLRLFGEPLAGVDDEVAPADWLMRSLLPQAVDLHPRLVIVQPLQGFADLGGYRCVSPRFRVQPCALFDQSTLKTVLMPPKTGLLLRPLAGLGSDCR